MAEQNYIGCLPETIIGFLQKVMELVMLVSFVLLILDDLADLLIFAGTAGIRTEVLVRIIRHPLVSVLIEAAATKKMHGWELKWTTAS